MRSKCKEVFPGDDREHQPTKKAKGKQLARYYRDIGIKMRDANTCEKCIHTRQDFLIYNSR